jgi:hypothetical protein
MIVDRFEGKYAICEKDGTFVELDRAGLPEGVSEGDVLLADENGELYVDRDATENRKKRIRGLMKKLFDK